MGETPYAMAFSCEVVILVEFGMANLRIQESQAEESKKGLHLNLDLLEERREEAVIRMVAYQQRK